MTEPSTSPWNLHVRMVPKKDGTYRFCVDYQALNSITQTSQYPIPRVDECVESLSGAMYFSTLDLAAGYWQVEVKPEDRHNTAFSTSNCHYHFCTMLMGLSGSPATFQWLMDLVSRGLHWITLLVTSMISLHSPALFRSIRHALRMFFFVRLWNFIGCGVDVLPSSSTTLLTRFQNLKLYNSFGFRHHQVYW